MPRAVIGAAVLAAVLLGCGDPIPRSEVRVTLDEYSLSLRPGRSDEGTVRIFIDNLGQEEHELVFVRARSVDELPLKPDGSVDLSKAQIADQLKPLAPGKYRIQPELFPGPLVVFCNLVTPGPDGKPVSHFAEGMHAELDIRQTTSAEERR